MAPQPYTAIGRLNIEYTVSGLLHKARVPCTPVIGGLPPFHLSIRNPSGSTVVALTAAQALWDLMRQNYQTTVGPASYLLEQNISGVFVPLESSVLTGSGASVGTTQLCNEITMTYKDTANRKFKFIMLEQAIPAPAHGSLPSGDAPLDAVINSFLSDVNPTDAGNWGVSRTALVISRFTFFTVALNKRVRRSRHLV